MNSHWQSTTRDDFVRVAQDRRVVPVSRVLFSDTETPVGMYRRLAGGRPGSFLLESAEKAGVWSRFSFVGVSSFGVLTQSGEQSVWIDYGLDVVRACGTSVLPAPLDALASLYSRWESAPLDGLPPLTGGLVGFIGWDMVRQIENLPDTSPSDFDVPVQALCFVADLVVIDHHLGTIHLVANALNDGNVSLEDLWDDAKRRLDKLQKSLTSDSKPYACSLDLDAQAHPISATKDAGYRQMVNRAKDHICAGDIFQVVLSKRFDLECEADPFDVYRILRNLNPSPYMYFLSLETTGRESYAIVGSSPEAQVKIESGRVVTHPIAGSRPRGATPEADRVYEEELLHDEKERAEHLMLVDLARNDLLKVCVPGSLEVTEFMTVEKFSHIMHIVSSVEGALREDVDPIDVFRATFPAGTLSGAPKPRALKIIDEYEPAARGVYGGAVGYIDFGGDADLAIAIRTAFIRNGVARIQAGAGLVYDSDPESELQECSNKAAAPLRAVAIANTMKSIQ